MNKKKILVFVTHYVPSYKYGGPLRSISNLIKLLSDRYKFNVFTLDRDKNEDESFDGIKVDNWNKVDGQLVYYCNIDVGYLKKIYRILREEDYDIIYLNSFFNFKFSIIPLILNKFIFKKPLVLSPRGQLSGGALKFSTLKKKFYLLFHRFFHLYDDIIWHATNNLEAQEIIKKIGVTTDKIVIANNLPSKPSNINKLKNKKKNDALNICFLSRISPKKNIEYSIKVLDKVDVPVVYDIYGPIDNGDYWDSFLKASEYLPRNISVNYKGSVTPDKVHSVLSQYDLFFLPTLGENFGHVISEALHAGTPVLISDNTPWKNLEKNGIGWSFSLDHPEKFSEIINDFYSQKDFKVEQMKKSIYEYIESTDSIKEEIYRYKELFSTAIESK